MGLDQDSFCFQSCTEGTETWIHVDGVTEWAAVFYTSLQMHH